MLGVSLSGADAALTAGVVGPLLFVTVFMVDGATRPGYRPAYHLVSALAHGRRGWVQTANFIASGLLITVAARGIEAATGSAWLAGSIGAFGLGLVASGIFPMDPMKGYPPGTPEGPPPELSSAHKLHDLAGFVVFAALPFAAAAAAFTLESRGWMVYSGATALVTAAGFLVFGAAWEQDHPRVGLIQRALIFVGWVWLALLCAHLIT